jgi:hypothetical protein
MPGREREPVKEVGSGAGGKDSNATGGAAFATAHFGTFARSSSNSGDPAVVPGILGEEDLAIPPAPNSRSSA